MRTNEERKPVVKKRAVKSGPYHGQAKPGSVERTQFYLASSGDYTPQAIQKIYQTPTTLADDLGGDAGQYNKDTKRVQLLRALSPTLADQIARHEYAHAFDNDRSRTWFLDPTPEFASQRSDFRGAFDAAGNTMTYPPGQRDVREARAFVGSMPWQFKGVEQFYPEFTPKAWRPRATSLPYPPVPARTY